jgi:UDP-N-acetylmuramate dehydrogenase
MHRPYRIKGKLESKFLSSAKKGMVMFMQKLREFCADNRIAVLWRAPMADYTSFRIGGPADALLFPDTEAQLVMALQFFAESQISFRVIGNATNLLISDNGYRGALITTRHIRSVSVSGTTVRAACGTPINVLCRMLADYSLGGMEQMYGIPGTVGGALSMNAGAFGVAVSDHLDFVSVFNLHSGKTEVIPRKECAFSYRTSLFRDKGHLVVLSADFTMIPTPCGGIRENMKSVLAKRMEKQPTALPSAGSAFLRPEGHYAGKLIEEAGLVGTRVGGAAVSVKHAGFIVNLGGATAKDVLDLIRFVQAEVERAFGIALTPEIEYIEEN